MQKYDGYYITPCGRVWSYKTNKWLKQKQLPNGYLQVDLNLIPTLVHRAVAECWLDNPNNLPQINHKDENKRNNKLDNLEWCDSYYNQAFSRGIKIKNVDTNEVFDSIRATARALNVTHGAIRNALNKPDYNGKLHIRYIN